MLLRTCLLLMGLLRRVLRCNDRGLPVMFPPCWPRIRLRALMLRKASSVLMLVWRPLLVHLLGPTLHQSCTMHGVPGIGPGGLHLVTTLLLRLALPAHLVLGSLLEGLPRIVHCCTMHRCTIVLRASRPLLPLMLLRAPLTSLRIPLRVLLWRWSLVMGWNACVCVRRPAVLRRLLNVRWCRRARAQRSMSRLLRVLRAARPLRLLRGCMMLPCRRVLQLRHGPLCSAVIRRRLLRRSLTLLICARLLLGC